MRKLGSIGYALAAFFLAATLIMGTSISTSADPHPPADQITNDAHAHFDSFAGKDCATDHQHQECSLSSGACTGHFTGTPVQYFFVPVSKLSVKPASEDAKFLALVFDLLRPPRI